MIATKNYVKRKINKVLEIMLSGSSADLEQSLLLTDILEGLNERITELEKGKKSKKKPLH